METLSNFSSIYCFITFIMGAVFMFIAVCVVAMGKVKEPRNKVHFYATKNGYGDTSFWIGKPIYVCNKLWMSNSQECKLINSYMELLFDKSIFDNMKEGEIREVFLNLED